ncbi:MAG: glycosyl transferase family 39 [Leptolyngbyaceae cyanobacterium RU_5_1]|nr:glycosyl transferase family 39 [Leptolyngbyaceae cyanobacterium RU_5_1]
MRFPVWLKGILVCLLIVGVVFRFVNLNHKVYWHDEVYTTMRAAGYTRLEIDQELFQNRQLLANELQTFQQIKPGSTAGDTIRSLAVEDPQHPPLYFVMTRFWMQAFGNVLTSGFGSPLTVQRSLPALLSLLALPAMYGLAWELFAAHEIALLATTLIALSPFDVLFAQTARQYSLLTGMVIASSFLLLRALRLSKGQKPSLYRSTAKSFPDWLNWGFYALAVAIGLYTHPFFGLTVIGHVVYLMLIDTQVVQSSPARSQRALWSFWMSLAAAVVLYSPWLFILVTNRQRALATTDWTQAFPGIDVLLKLWILSFTSLFLDLDFGYNNPWTIVSRIPILVLIGVSFYTLYRRTGPATWLFVLTSVFVPFLLLVLPDFLMGGKRSAVSRYFISCFPGVQLAVAYFLASTLSLKTVYSGRSPRLTTTSTPYTLHPKPYTLLKTWFWRGALTLLLIASLASLTASALAESWWNKDLSYFNDKIARLINATPAPIVISDIGDDYTNTGDLISLSYRLKDDVSLFLVKSPRFVRTAEFKSVIQEGTAIAFRPSGRLKQALEQTFGDLPRMLVEERLWKLPLP